MKRIGTFKPLRARAIYLTGKQPPLKDRLIMFTDGFLIVAKDEDDPAPVWYNINRIDHLEGVEELTPATKSEGHGVWF